MKKTLLIIVAIIVVIAIAVGAYLLVSTSTTKVKFEGNQCLAIGFIAKGKEAEFSEKYLKNSDEFNILTTISSGDEEQFVVIPKDRNSKIKVWTYKATEEGEIVIDKVIAENVNKPVLIKAETAEVMPKVGIEYSSEDGKLVLGENSSLIKDISEY